MDWSLMEELTVCIIDYDLAMEMARAPRPVDGSVLVERVKGGASA